jgi:hypothetical protein
MQLEALSDRVPLILGLSHRAPFLQKIAATEKARGIAAC